MKKLKPYWFLEFPLDTEHKYYILMDFLIKTKKSIGKSSFVKNFSFLLSIKRDLINFEKESELTQRTMISMTDGEKNNYYKLLDCKTEDVKEVVEIVKNSIKTIDNFLKENREAELFYNSLVKIESYCNKYNLWDQGFIVIRKEEEKYMRVFSWGFSIVKIAEKESVALLMTELLDPLCETTNEIKEIREFFKTNIKDYSYKYDCVIVSSISNKVDMDIGTDISKEKSIEIIINNFKGD